MTVALATISLGNVRIEMAQSVVGVKGHPVWDSWITKNAGHYLDVARNQCCEQFLEIDTEPEWLLFVDGDHTDFDGPKIEQLIGKADERHRVIGGVYLQATDPIGPCVYRWDYADEFGTDCFVQVSMDDIRNAERDDCGYVAVDAVGTGFMAIHRTLIEEMRHVWHLPQAPFDEKVINGITMGEDFTFCARVKYMGYNVYIQPDVRIGHVKSLNLMEAN